MTYFMYGSLNYLLDEWKMWRKNNSKFILEVSNYWEHFIRNRSIQLEQNLVWVSK